jgi:hypothetical protein
LAFIQPFMALMRPMPNAPNRYIFNWAHMLVGYSAHILASNEFFSQNWFTIFADNPFALFSYLHLSCRWNGRSGITLWNLLDFDCPHLLLCGRASSFDRMKYS